VAYSWTLRKIRCAPHSYQLIHLRHLLWNMGTANYFAWYKHPPSLLNAVLLSSSGAATGAVGGKVLGIVHCGLRLRGVVLSFSVRFKTWVFWRLPVPVIQLTTVFGVFFGVISHPKPFLFWFSWVNFAGLGTVFLLTVPTDCCIPAIHQIPVRMLPRCIAAMGTFRL